MSKRKKFKFSKCGHLGRGAECNRCKDGQKLVDLATAGALSSEEHKRLSQARDTAYDKARNWAVASLDLDRALHALPPGDADRALYAEHWSFANRQAARQGQKAQRLAARAANPSFDVATRANMAAEGKRLLAPSVAPTA